MSLGVSIGMDGGKAAIGRLDGVGRRAGDATPAMQAIHRSFLAGERYQFSSQGAGRWQPLTPRYEKRKAATGRDTRVMRATGELYRALSTGRGAGAVAEIRSDGATFGTSLRHAVFAQYGSGRRRRRVVAVSRSKRARWRGIIRTHLLRPAR